MCGHAVRLLSAVLFVVTAVVRAQNQDVYFAVGEALVLKPKGDHESITSITWKSKGDIVTEFIQDQVELEDYGDFKGRTRLDLRTGVLTLKPTRPGDAGPFTVEINNQVQAGGYNAVMLQKVSRPAVIIRPLTCTQTSSTCSLTCEGDTKDRDPVSYAWKLGDGDWEESGKARNFINNEKTKAVELLFCKMKNPVSEAESQAQKNPFYQPDSPAPIGLIVGILFAVVVVVGLVAAFFMRERLMALVSGSRSGSGGVAGSSANDNGDPETVVLKGDTSMTAIAKPAEQ